MNPVTAFGVGAIAVVSITSHAAAHGFMADRLGDSTARKRGRLTLNPIPHIDVFFTILLPLFLMQDENSGSRPGLLGRRSTCSNAEPRCPDVLNATRAAATEKSGRSA